MKTPGWWRTYVTEVVADTEATAEQHRMEVPRSVSLRQVVVVLIAAATSLTLINFLRGPGTLDAFGGSAMTGNIQFNYLVWWALVSITCYVLIPVVAIFALRGSFADFGAGRSIGRGSWRPYGLLFAFSAPFVVMASYMPGFQLKYPFYHLSEGESIWPHLAIFWVLYALQFIALEFFFRGFLLFGLAPRLGISAVFVMVVPYAMIHFTKPFAEALSAILGGAVLGFLSLKTNSAWWGAVLHIAIAMSMDLLALRHAGFL